MSADWKTAAEISADIKSGDVKIEDLIVALWQRIDELDAIVAKLEHRIPKTRTDRR
jgi:hypothetical protein